MKVFLSHSTKDKPFVQTLAAELQSEQIEPWLCEIDVDCGDNFAAKIEEGLREADLAVLFWSPEAARSGWTHREWTSVTDREIAEARTRLGVVLLRECPLPELLRVKHRIDARTDPEKARRETVAWIKRLRDMRRIAEKKAPGVFLPPPPLYFIGRTELLEMLFAALAEDPGNALLCGEPGCGKSTLALKFAWQAQGAFDAVVFQSCGRRSVAAIAAELSTKLELRVETKPPEKQIVAIKKWLLAERRALLLLDDVWENDAVALAPGPPVSLLCTSRRRSLPWISPPHWLEVKSFSRDEAESIFRIYLRDEIKEHRAALLEFAERVEYLPIAIVAGADLLQRELDPVPEAAHRLRLERLHSVTEVLRCAICARLGPERRLLEAMALCAPEGFWLPLPVQMAGLSETEGCDARNQLVGSSLVRMLDRDRQRFQLHGLLREQLRTLAPVAELQAAHAGILEALFRDWEGRWRECRECLSEVIPAVQHLRGENEGDRAARLSYWGFKSGRRVGELEMAFRIIQHEGALCREAGDKTGLQASYGQQATVLQTWGRLEEALVLLKKREALCRELGNKDGLQAGYGHQAMILHAWSRSEEALMLLKKQEALCRELNTKNGLQWSYGHQATVLQTWGRLEEALALLRKQEALCRELGNNDRLRWSYASQAVILHAWGRLEEALAVLKEQEALCQELGHKDGLQESYGNQAVMLRACSQLEEALALHKKQEALCRELGNRNALAFCYWQWGLLARQRRDRPAEREKLTAALEIFTKLGMSQERGAVQAELDKTNATDGGKAG